MLRYWKLHKVPMVMILISSIFYYVLAYHFERSQFIKLVLVCLGLFALCFKLIQFEKWNFKLLLLSGIVFRLIFLFAIPNLSQDFYRFIWDGELVRHFISPYLKTPNELIDQPGLVISNAKELFHGMGDLSPNYYSNYPPLNQIIFAIASLLGGKSILGSVIILRIIILFADIGIVYFGCKLLNNLNRSAYLIFWYFLNPLVLIELTGNLHFEGVMLFFFVWSLYLLSKNDWKWAGVIYALSISIKLVPLLFLPLFLKYFRVRKSLLFYSIVGSVSLLLLVPFYATEFISNYSETVGLWFSNFEFNASVYNVVKSISVFYFEAKPWELIKIYGKITPFIIFAIAVLFTLFRQNQKFLVLVNSMLWVLSIYYFMATTVHPWYIIFLVLLTIFTDYKYALLWSGVIILSYCAYGNPKYIEHLGILAIEYIAVFTFMFYEISKQRYRKL